ncbi:hypothetical protein Tco_0078930 [Tanacetum coccineum]
MLWEKEKTISSHNYHAMIGSYDLIISKDDEDWMMDYLFSNDGPAFVREEFYEYMPEKHKAEEKLGERTNKLCNEFDKLAKTNGCPFDFMHLNVIMSCLNTAYLYHDMAYWTSDSYLDFLHVSPYGVSRFKDIGALTFLEYKRKHFMVEFDKLEVVKFIGVLK